MIHSRMKTLHALVAVLAILALSSCATAPRQPDPVSTLATNYLRDRDAFNQKVQAHNARVQAHIEQKNRLMDQMSNEQLAAYAAIEENVNSTAKMRLSVRKFWSAMDSNAALSESFNQCLMDSGPLDEEANSLIEEQKKLDQRREYLRTFAGMYYNIQQEQKAEQQAYIHDYIEQQNWNNLNNEIRNLGNTIQNNSRGGATVVVPR
jgi:hypothetical protein